MTPLYPSYVKWDSRWRPAGKRCTTLGTLESMLPWTGSWAIWMTQVCRAEGIYQKATHQSVWPLLSLLMFSSLSLAADFSAPLVLPGCSSGAGTTPTESLSEEHLATIVSMGFSRDQATKALRATVRIKLRPVRDADLTNFTCYLSKSRAVPVQAQLLPFLFSNVAKCSSFSETLTSVGLNTSTKMSSRILLKVAFS